MTRFCYHVDDTVSVDTIVMTTVVYRACLLGCAVMGGTKKKKKKVRLTAAQQEKVGVLSLPPTPSMYCRCITL